jgi:hypothetical protein
MRNSPFSILGTSWARWLCHTFLFAVALSALFACSTRLISREPSSSRFSCSELTSLFLGSRTERFSAQKYHSLKKSLQALEVLSARQNFSPLEGVHEIKKSSFWWKRHLKKALKKFENGDELTERQVEVLVSELYRLSHPLPLWKRTFGLLVTAETHKEYLLRRIHEELATKNLLEVFKDLGLLREPSNIGRFQAKYRQHRNRISLSLTTAFNLISVAHSDPLIVVPNLKKLDRIEIPPHLVDKIFEQGIESVKPELMALWGPKAKFDIGWMRFRRVVHTMVLGYILYSLPSELAAIQNELAEEFQKDFFIEEAEDEELELFVTQLIDDWKANYEETQQRLPTLQETEDMAALLRFLGGKTR